MLEVRVVATVAGEGCEVTERGVRGFLGCS